MKPSKTKITPPTTFPVTKLEWVAAGASTPLFFTPPHTNHPVQGCHLFGWLLRKFVGPASSSAVLQLASPRIKIYGIFSLVSITEEEEHFHLTILTQQIS